MSTFAVVACRSTPTNRRLGAVLTPAQAAHRLRAGDVALGRIDVLSSLHGVEPGLWALDVLERRGVMVLNRRAALEGAHDKLATAGILEAAGIPHPPTAHVAPWLPIPDVDFPVVLKPRFGSLGADVVRCETAQALARALDDCRLRVWFNTTGGVLQQLVPPRGYDLRIVVAGGHVVGAVQRVAGAGEWRTNVALGATRVPTVPPPAACELALAAAGAGGADLVGVDLLPVGTGDWTVLELNGAVDFNGTYSLGDEVFSAARSMLLRRAAGPFAALREAPVPLEEAFV
jgi:RimK family alpha-L-glutamate ligase